jgi:hypothetical protein
LQISCMRVSSVSSTDTALQGWFNQLNEDMWYHTGRIKFVDHVVFLTHARKSFAATQ